MSDPTSTPAPEGDQTPEGLRDFANRMKADAESAASEAAALREQNRTLALTVAGVDLESPVGKLFVKANPELTSVDEIKAAWAEVAPQSAPPPADDGPTEAELANQAARQALTTGGQPPGEEPTPDPWPDALAGFRADREKGVRVEQAQKNVLQKIVDAAGAGDERVLFDDAAWKAQFQR